jgi:hypothetical protein
MRDYFVPLVLLSTIVPSISWARSDDLPTLDVRPVCRGIASQSGDPGLGAAGQTETFRQCMESEQGVLEQLRKEWSAFSAADKRHCVTLAKTGGESSNTELMTCLEMARDVRVLRSAAASPPGVDDTKATSSPSTPAVQPAPGGAPQEPTPSKQPPKADGDAAMREVERAKAEAQAAKESEALVRRKLADAESALQRVKEETTRAIADAERAKADAKAARESEAVATRKLADADAARVAAENSCQVAKTRPVLERLRGLFRRPGNKND